MRLAEVQVAGFRAFGRIQRFALDADVTIVNGANGQGKTSFFDAILWGLTGCIPRLSDDDHDLLSKFSETGQIEVTVALENDRRERIVIRRSFDGEQQNVRMEIEQVYRNSEAEAAIQKLLWPNASGISNVRKNLASAITRTVYLQQDSLREFLTADDEKSRFRCVADLLGVGRLSDLRTQLDRARTAWSTVTNQRAQELSEAEKRIARLRDEVQRSDKPELPPMSPEAWSNWWTQVCALRPELRQPSPDQPQASAILNDAIRLLYADSNTLQRRRDWLLNLQAEVNNQVVIPVSELDVLRDEARRIQEKQRFIRERLNQERENLAKLREALAESQALQEKTAVFARIGLDLLGETCPVCLQTYDREAVRTRLSSLAAGSPQQTALRDDSVRDLEVQLMREEKAAIEVESRLHSAELAVQKYASWRASVENQLRELGVDLTSGIENTITKSLLNVEQQIQLVRDVIQRGEQLSVVLVKLTDRSRASELRSQLSSMEQDIAGMKIDVANRQETWQLGTNALEGLREAELQIVRLQLDEINPLIQRIYSRIDPNPVFRNVSLTSRFLKGQGQLNPLISDATTNTSSERPDQLLSSSQLNAFALSLFAALNLGLPVLPLDALLLDDPLQSLDDVTLLGVADLLRRIKPIRQLVVSTHDHRVAELLQRKLRPATHAQNVRVIGLSGWGRQGPDVEIESVQADRQRLRIAV
jgi:DNA repair exonuclease SbcCD ATPase subunit